MSYLSPDVYQPQITEADAVVADAAGDGDGSTIFLPIVTTGGEAPPFAVFDPDDPDHQAVVNSPFQALVDIASRVGGIIEEIDQQFVNYALTAQPDSPPPTATQTPEAETTVVETKEPTGLAKLLIDLLARLDRAIMGPVQEELNRQKYPYQINLPIVANETGEGTPASSGAAESADATDRAPLVLLAVVIAGFIAARIKRD